MIKFAEFCAGIGGFSLGIKMSGIESECVYSNEIDPQCEKTFFRNFGFSFDSHDIFNVAAEKLPNFDILCSGFPCQPFSVAGKRKGFDDGRGLVIFKLLDIVSVKRPRVVFLENVPNLQWHDRGKTDQYIRKQFQALGYTVFSSVLNSRDFGVPQSRPRYYILAFRDNHSSGFVFPKGLMEPKTLRDVLNPGDYTIPISKKWEWYIDLYTNKVSISEVPFSVPKTRRTLERVSDGCDLFDCVLQIRSSGIRAYSLDSQFPTFAVSHSGGGAMIPVLTKERRHLSSLEIQRLMGFPDDYLFPVSRTDQIKQLSNAVCPPVISALYQQIHQYAFV